MHRVVLLVALVVWSAHAAGAVEYVITPDGERVRLREQFYGVPSPFPHTEMIPIERYKYYKKNQDQIK